MADRRLLIQSFIRRLSDLLQELESIHTDLCEKRMEDEDLHCLIDDLELQEGVISTIIQDIREALDD